MKKLILILTALLASASCGKDGTNGIDGRTGQPGTQVGVIQFCPGIVPTYPTTFPEVGFCIEGQIYAVYSQNDGFLTLIPPGIYNSNAVGSACNFTVLPNCVLQ